MSFRLREGHRVFVYREQIDFRAGFDKLAMLVREKMKMELIEGDLFLFLGKNRKRLKSLCYDGTGLILISKRLERGRFMSVSEFEESELTVDELNYVISGGVVRKKYFGERALQAAVEPLFSENGLVRAGVEYRGAAQAGHLPAR
jgi:transposase